MRKIQILVVSIALTLLAGCASAPEPKAFEPSAKEGKAVVYHYRPARSVGAAENYYVAVNGEPLTVVENGTVYREIAEPGKLTYSADRFIPSEWALFNFDGFIISNAEIELVDVLSFDAAENEVYFVEWSTKSVKQVDQEQAVDAIKSIRQGWE